jgi:hypothetical protein
VPELPVEPALLNRGAGDEPSPRGVGLWVDVELASTRQQGSGAERDIERSGGRGELHRPTVEGLNALVLDLQSFAAWWVSRYSRWPGRCSTSRPRLRSVVGLVVAQDEVLA